MDATTPRHGVLVIGLDPYRVPGPWDPTPVADAIQMGLARFADHGVYVETCLFGLDGSDDVEAVVGVALRAQPWEVVVVGGGVRKSEEQLERFETMVNLIRRDAPDAAIAFNSAPDDTYEAAARWLGRAGREGSPMGERADAGAGSESPNLATSVGSETMASKGGK